MGHYHISTPPPPLEPGDRFKGSRYGTVNHIARAVARRDQLRSAADQPGLFVMAYCGIAGVLPDTYVDDGTARHHDPAKRVCRNCNERYPR